MGKIGHKLLYFYPNQLISREKDIIHCAKASNYTPFYVSEYRVVVTDMTKSFQLCDPNSQQFNIIMQYVFYFGLNVEPKVLIEYD